MACKFRRPAACKASPSRDSRQTGLTLIELLVAISVLAFVAVLGWRGLDGIVRARIGLTGSMEQTRGMQLAFAQMQSDCSHIATPDLLPGRAPLAAEQGRLLMVRTVFADNQPTRLQVITYRVRDGVLSRRESTATRDLKELDSLWQAASNDTDPNPSVALQEGVASMSMRLWSNKTNSWQLPGANGVQAGTAAANAPGGAQAQTSTANASAQTPQQAQAAQAAQQAQAAPSGLEVALHMQEREASMLKVFLLGAV